MVTQPRGFNVLVVIVDWLDQSVCRALLNLVGELKQSSRCAAMCAADNGTSQFSTAAEESSQAATASQLLAVR